MSSSTNTVCKSHRSRRGRGGSLVRCLSMICLGLIGLAATSYAQDVDLRAPSAAVAGTASSITTTGSGSATFYLTGPGIAVKRDVHLGAEITLGANDLRSAGKYLAIVCASNCRSVGFFVAPAKPADLAFLVHPSRAPVGQNDVVSGVALPFDEFHNLVLAPATVDFQLTSKGATTASQRVSTQDGIAWFHTSSGRESGTLQVTASINDVSARRVVQQVASDPCSLHIKGQRTPKGIAVETEPVRDCTGNPVPDGTIITFTSKNAMGTDTVDAPVKQGIARAQLAANGPAVVSAASGVVMGNELRVAQ
jgi:hypothetical protein